MAAEQNSKSENPYIAIRFKDEHVFVYDPTTQTKRIPHQFFDIHDVCWRGFDPKYILRFPWLSGIEHERAIYVYNQWLDYHDVTQIRQLSSEFFKIEKDIPPPPVQKVIAEQEITVMDVGSERQVDFRMPVFDRKAKNIGIHIQAAVERDGLKKTKSQRIQDISLIRGLKQLVHFTRIQNLENIFKNGLLSRSDLDRNNIIYLSNDDLRLDQQLASISLSISFPNYKLFHKYKQNSPNNWVVIALFPQILWELDCAFCYQNAASKDVSDIPLDILQQADAFEDLFDDNDWVERKKLHIPDCFPTNPQAEILVMDPIPVKYFSAVYFYDVQSRNKWHHMNPIIQPDILAVEREFFSPRCDWGFWRTPSNNSDTIQMSPEDIPF